MIDLDLIYYRHNCYEKSHNMKKNVIDFFELTIVLDGEMDYIIGGERVELKSGDAVFLRRGDIRERYLITEPVDYVSFNFYSLYDFVLPLYIKGALTREIRHLIAACDQLNGKIDMDRYKTVGFVLETILRLLQERNDKVYSEITESILEYITANYNKKVTLGMLEAEMHFSAIYCDTIFKQEIGKSIIDYLIDIRIEEAKSLLINSEYSVKDISYLTGYEDQNYFSRLFKKRVGYTPTSYRSSMLKDVK